MDADRWARVQELFDAALAQPEEARGRWLETACAGDDGLRAEVRSLLEEDAHDRLAPIVAGAAGSVLAEDASLVGSEDLRGRGVGPYRIVREIGRGGMGVVYLADRADGQFNRQVAIKVVRDRLADPEVVERFRVERQILARLTHPNIARLLDGGATADRSPYVVMEYVDGVPLDRFCAERGLSVEERVRLFVTLCDAVREAHRHLVVHRDLKPTNVLVEADGTPKLLDFGIARLLDPADAPGGALTRTGSRVLTPRYASPEQVRGEPVSTASDVYSLGVMLYELLTGASPYAADDAVHGELERAICEQVPEPPSTSIPLGERGGPPPGAAPRRIGGDLDNVVLMALAKEPERRYASAAEFADDLRRYLDGMPVAARPSTWSYRASKFVRRHRLAVAASAVVAAALAGTSVVSTTLYLRTARAETTASAVNRFLDEMLGSVDPTIARGEDVTLMRRILDRTAARLDDELAGQPEVAASLHGTIGSTYHGIGLYDEAERHARAALDLFRATLGPDRPETISAIRRLSVVLQEQGRYPEAGEHAREALRLARERFGDDAVETATSLHDLGSLKFRTLDLSEAETAFREALAIRRRKLGPDHPQTADSLMMLGTVMTTPGVEDPETGETFLREALAIYRRAGERHLFRLAEVSHNLAGSLAARGELDRAEPLYREALAILRRILTDDHPRTAVTVNRLASLHESRGDLATAEALYLEALEVQRRALGPDHRDYGTTLNNLAGLYRKSGRFAEAGARYEEALAIYRRALGREHVWVGIVLGSIAANHEAAGEFAACERVAEECLRIRSRTWEPDHWRIATVDSIRGGCAARSGDLAAAEPVLLDALARLRAALGPEDERTRTAAERVAALYDARGRPDLAAAYRPGPAAAP